jgi:L-alanine-DL-glutamate epimerase-like enolase superfamily enzyme
LTDKPVIQTQLIDTPVIIDFFALIKNGGAWFLRVRGKQGEEGIAPCSGQADYFYPILQKRVDETGVKAIKFKRGGRMSRNADSLEGRTEGILRLVRKHFGDGMIIHSDGNGSFDAAKGIEVGKIVESINCVPGGLTVKDGRVRIPEGPGLGLELGIVNKSGAQVIFDLRS